MFSERLWVVLMVAVSTGVCGGASRALSIYQKQRSVPMFVPRSYRRFRRVQFLDEAESNQPLGKGEIDLTERQSRIKFDNTDYDVTDDVTESPLKMEGTERFYLPVYPKFYNGRFSRPYAPSFSFEPVISVPPRTGYFPNSGWKARSPRVVFPYSPDGNINSVLTNSHAGPNFNDNVVFREQNFGTSDIGAEEQTLQDISSPVNNDAFSDRDANEPHRAQSNEIERLKYIIRSYERRYTLQKPMFVQTELTERVFQENVNMSHVLPEFRPISDAQIQKINDIIKEITSTNRDSRRGRVLDKPDPVGIENKKIERQYEKNCPQGGTCEFFFYCWMVGGLLDGSCGSLLKGCCHRVAKSGILGVQDSNSLEFTPNEGLSYGPVINDESCGVAANKQTAQRRIVGGDDAGFGTFPWQAYIRIGSSRCGGSLISRRHVVTAGHCVARAQPRHVRVTLGDYVINSAAEPFPAYTFGVRSIKVHPLFKFTPQADRFDVAVLTLDRNVQYMPHIAPICLPERGSDFLGQYGWAAGWGALSPGSRLRPRTLQAVDVPVIDNRVCERWHRANGINVVIYPEMLCAGYRGGGKDSCQGDSGGPLMLERGGRWTLVGVVSAGYSCASRGQPGIYHRVAHTVDWISHATTLT
ncbi:unnamed protein product [Danaus chrysippus]|uniref:(African queen) hypothetical protein n=1 Tax=Danaus chrysippus TaxID=151541 RepID=A0A8J2QW25_9NEOP|nr:unnamed protein product [Danaus chrysippus]